MFYYILSRMVYDIFIYYFIYFILLYFICHTIITKNIGKEEKKKWRGDLTETIGAYERLGLLELWARAVSHQLKKRRRKVEDGKTYELFSYLLIIIIIMNYWSDHLHNFQGLILLGRGRLIVVILATSLIVLLLLNRSF